MKYLLFENHDDYSTEFKSPQKHYFVFVNVDWAFNLRRYYFAVLHLVYESAL